MEKGAWTIIKMKKNCHEDHIMSNLHVANLSSLIVLFQIDS